MKSVLAVSVFSALVGLGLGAMLAYVQVPKTVPLVPAAETNKQPAGQPVAEKFPKAEVPELVYEFSNIERGTSMSHEFKVRNVGQLPLTLEVASTTCKCTVGDLSKNKIGPDEETVVLLEWVAKTGPGPFRHGAVLRTNDPARTTIDLTVEGQVVESTAMSPPELIFGTVTAGESPSASLYLMSFLDQDIEIRDYELSDEAVAKQIEIRFAPAELSELPSPDAAGGLKVTATYRSGKTVGPFRSWLTITTNLKNAEKLTVPIAGSVVGDVSIFGDGWVSQKGLLRMGSFPSAKGKKVTLKVAVRGEHAQKSQLEVAEIDPPQLKVSLGDPRKMGQQLLHVPLVIEVPPGTQPIVRLGEPVSSDATIVLRSNHAEIPDVRLRVWFAVE